MSALRSVCFAMVLGLAAWPASAQEHVPEGEAAKVDIITPHITDGYHMELPWFAPPFYKEICLGRHVGEHGCEALWPDIHVGPLTLNLSPTKHVVFLFIAAFVVSALLIGAARAHRKHTHAVGRPRGFSAGVEAIVLYIRNEVILPNVGHHGNGFVPYLLTCFFFILTANLLGLIPYGSTSTGNIAVTGSLALMTFITTEVAGMKALGSGYLSTIFYWNKDLPMVMRIAMLIIVSPVELIGKFTKPFALAIRLFANMTAGHIVLLAFIGLIFTFKSYAVALAPVSMAVALSLLELMVAFLQAFIFTLLSSVFIGLIRESHH
jgi:F-type H+-transporting ATPase subunit a